MNLKQLKLLLLPLYAAGDKELADEAANLLDEIAEDLMLLNRARAALDLSDKTTHDDPWDLVADAGEQILLGDNLKRRWE